jgi:hypothetical protein
MTDEELYQRCRDTVDAVRAFGDLERVHAELGPPMQVLPTDGFFVTHPDLSVTHCDLVELYHFDHCAIRVGYVRGTVAKVRGMPLAHWRAPDA